MNKKVLILMSTFNGGLNIRRQVKSIIEQNNVDVHIKIRDDGSDFETKEILKSIQDEFPDKISCSFENNVGWKQSFMKLLFTAEVGYDYYGFSDQDDLWLEDKLVSCIKLMDADVRGEIKLVHCNAISVDSNLQKREEQEYRFPWPPSHKAAIATEYFQGCGMLWNAVAMRVLQGYYPQNKELAHDYWVGLICYFFGKVYFCEEPKFYHIRYENNSSEDGNVNKGRIKRLKMLIRGLNAYMNPARDLYDGFSNLMDPKDKQFCNMLIGYKTNILYKMSLLTDMSFVRPSVMSSILFKLTILLNKY